MQFEKILFIAVSKTRISDLLTFSKPPTDESKIFVAGAGEVSLCRFALSTTTNGAVSFLVVKACSLYGFLKPCTKLSIVQTCPSLWDSFQSICGSSINIRFSSYFHFSQSRWSSGRLKFHHCWDPTLSMNRSSTAWTTVISGGSGIRHCVLRSRWSSGRLEFHQCWDPTLSMNGVSTA